MSASSASPSPVAAGQMVLTCDVLGTIYIKIRHCFRFVYVRVGYNTGNHLFTSCNVTGYCNRSLTITASPGGDSIKYVTSVVQCERQAVVYWRAVIVLHAAT